MPLVCERCQRPFNQRAELEQHLQTEHVERTSMGTRGAAEMGSSGHGLQDRHRPEQDGRGS